MTAFQIVLDELLRHTSSARARYARQIARALAHTAPDGIDVVGFVGLHDESEIAALTDDIPGIARVESLAIKSWQMDIGWRFGIPPQVIPDGITHSPTMLTPRFRHDHVNEPGHQTVATLHDITLWTTPDAMRFAERELAKIAWRRAEATLDAFVTTSNYVAEVLAAETRIGDRVRVIPAAPTHLVDNGSRIADLSDLDLPAQYLAISAEIDEPTLLLLITALRNSQRTATAVLFGEPRPYSKPLPELMTDWGLEPDALTEVGALTEAEELSLIAHARGCIVLSSQDTLGLSILDAMDLGVPVAHIDNPAYVELSAGAAIVLESASPDFVEQLSDAIDMLATTHTLPQQLAIEGQDRSENFSWDDSAQQIWQLHADL